MVFFSWLAGIHKIRREMHRETKEVVKNTAKCQNKQSKIYLVRNIHVIMLILCNPCKLPKADI